MSTVPLLEHSTQSEQYDIGDKGYIDRTERVTNKCDTNNDANVDTNEAVIVPKTLFKKTLVAASGLLALAFLGTVGLSSVTKGGLVEVHAGEMVNVQASRFTLHPEIVPESQRRLAVSRDLEMAVAYLPMSPANFSRLFDRHRLGHQTLSFSFRVKDKNTGVKQKETGNITVFDDIETRQIRGGTCRIYNLQGEKAPYNVPFNVTCCDPGRSGNHQGRCNINCRCADLDAMAVVWGEDGGEALWGEDGVKDINWGSNGAGFIHSSLDEDETYQPTAETLEPKTLLPTSETWAPTLAQRLTTGTWAQARTPSPSVVLLENDAETSSPPVVLLENDAETSDRDLDHPRDRSLLSTKCCRRSHDRKLLSELDLVSEMKQRGDESCLGEHYKLAVQALGSHLLVVAVPQEGTTCPMVVADSGYTQDSQVVDYEEGVPVLSKHVTIMEVNSVTEDEIKSMLFFGNALSLAGFYDAVQVARTTASKQSSLHGIVGNCATFILDVMTDLQIDFGKKDMQTELIKFVTQALMKSEERDTIVAGIKKKITSRAVKAWVRLRGDNYVLKKFVKTFLKNYKIN